MGFVANGLDFTPCAKTKGEINNAKAKTTHRTADPVHPTEQAPGSYWDEGIAASGIAGTIYEG
jgi:hypothetical protein